MNKMEANENLFNLNKIEELDALTCFKAFDKSHNNKLDIKNFKLLHSLLFQNASKNTYEMERTKTQEIFNIFDKNDDGYIDYNEFLFCWDKWIKVVLKPKSALLIIDVQNDFISGSLNISNCPAKENGIDVVESVNQLLESVKFDSVFYSLDWHPQKHISFIENVNLREIHSSCPIQKEKIKVYDSVVFSGPPKVTQVLWPSHCIQNTHGAQLHPNLKITDNAIKIYKGTNPEIDSYSAFWDNQKISATSLHEQLQSQHITDVYVCGIAWDYCAGHSALDALAHGYRTVMIEDCLKALDFKVAQEMKDTLVGNNAIIVDSSCVGDMVQGLDRKPILGYKLATALRKK